MTEDKMAKWTFNCCGKESDEVSEGYFVCEECGNQIWVDTHIKVEDALNSGGSKVEEWAEDEVEFPTPVDDLRNLLRGVYSGEVPTIRLEEFYPQVMHRWIEGLPNKKILPPEIENTEPHFENIYFNKWLGKAESGLESDVGEDKFECESCGQQVLVDESMTHTGVCEGAKKAEIDSSLYQDRLKNTYQNYWRYGEHDLQMDVEKLDEMIDANISPELIEDSLVDKVVDQKRIEWEKSGNEELKRASKLIGYYREEKRRG